LKKKNVYVKSRVHPWATEHYIGLVEIMIEPDEKKK